MSDTIITVENLGKKYVIAHEKPERYTALRDVIANGAKSFGQKLFKGQKTLDTSEKEEFWALKDVSFEIKRGDRVGIIGRNGAGKSTLLKILSRITEPTTGKISIKGRVASLLEVGTGFHPELTGRENIFLNGAILGMSRVEIKKKFDEIVAFAEVEKFLDTPVKRYSSGMYVRLAFAVAAHLEPEILIVDEVLAVGDAQFQKKCLGKMEDVANNEGRTVLFVSHNMSAIQSLCNQIIYMKFGQIESLGDVNETINLYLSDSRDNPNYLSSVFPLKISKSLKINLFSISPNPIETGQSLDFCVEFSSENKIKIAEVAILVYSILGTRVSIIDLRNHHLLSKVESENSLKISGSIKELPLVEGEYNIGLYIVSHDVSENFLDLLTLIINSKPKTDNIIPYSPLHRGFVELKLLKTSCKS
ncbi:ABC transporter ATP-binding protein [Geminocystis herdmanii]|uniref:ABC transporter ATP-binding protein n=1 Tax=Geminocystis herdmanii TaxID=669359 RepID=UPI00034CF22F|nr:polysaccharide ABC transporter ATP-binding protein [Geminocystis herdmanii]